VSTTTTTAAPEEATAPTPTKTRRFSLIRFVGLLTPVLLVVGGYASIAGADASDSGPLGLIEVMNPAYFGFIGLLAASFVWHMRSKTLDTPVLGMHIVALIFLFHGAVSWIEQVPRFPVVYTHVGLSEYIQRTGETLPTLDARMNWPGFFTAAALLNEVAGVESIYPWLLWAPLVQNLFYAPLLFSITRTASTDARVPWIALYLYFSLSWVGQDYFSPQALNFLFFLTFVAIVLRCFRTDRAALPRPIRRIGNGVGVIVGRILRVKSFQPGGAPILATTTAQRSLLVFALAVIYAASVMSHQLTPVFLLLFVTALVVLRRTVLRGFPLLMAVLFFSYISYGAIGYWSGHLDAMFGGFGKLGGIFKDNVGSKVEVESSHVYVIYARFLLAAGVWALTAWGLIRRLRAGRVDIALLVGFIVPFFVLGGQTYGGEVILRVFLMSLPFAAIFITFALLPTEKLKLNITRSVVFVLICTLLGPMFMLTRYGNEAFEYVSKDDYEAALELARLAPADSNMITIDANVGNQLARMEQFAFVVVPQEPGEPLDYSVQHIYQTAVDAPGNQSFLLLSRSQIANIELTYGKPKTFFQDITRDLIANPNFRLIYENADARIFAIDTSAGTKSPEVEDE
jgi:hypothetical protein